MDIQRWYFLDDYPYDVFRVKQNLKVVIAGLLFRVTWSGTVRLSQV